MDAPSSLLMLSCVVIYSHYEPVHVRLNGFTILRHVNMIDNKNWNHPDLLIISLHDVFLFTVQKIIST